MENNDKVEQNINRHKDKVSKMYVVLAVMVVCSILVIMIACKRLNPDSWKEIIITCGATILGRSVGGIATLFAISESNRMTREVQQQNRNDSNRQLRIVILNNKIKEYSNLRKLVMEFDCNIINILSELGKVVNIKEEFHGNYYQHYVDDYLNEAKRIVKEILKVQLCAKEKNILN